MDYYCIRSYPRLAVGKKGMLRGKIGAVAHYYSSLLLALRGQGEKHYYFSSLRSYRIQREPDSDIERLRQVTVCVCVCVCPHHLRPHCKIDLRHSDPK